MSIGPTSGPGGPGDLLNALRTGRVQGGEEARLKAATQLMEGQFYQELFKVMRETIPQDGLMGGGQGEEMFTSLLDQQVADAAAAQSDRGIGAALYRHFVRAGLVSGGEVPLDTRLASAVEGPQPMDLERGTEAMPLEPSGPQPLPVERPQAGPFTIERPPPPAPEQDGAR